MTKEFMMDEVIKARGFEDEWTIWFCGLCENEKLDINILTNAFIVALNMPFEED